MTFTDKVKSICGRKEFLMCSNALIPPTSSKIMMSDSFTTALRNLLPEVTTDTIMHNFSKTASMCDRPHWSQGNNYTAPTKYCFDWNINMNNSDAGDDEFESSKHSRRTEVNSSKHTTSENTKKTGQYGPSDEIGLIITAQEKQTHSTGNQRRLSERHLRGPKAGEQTHLLEEIFSTPVFYHSLSDMDRLPYNGESGRKVNSIYNLSSEPRYADLHKTTSLSSCPACLEIDQPDPNWTYLTPMKLRTQQVGKRLKTLTSLVSEGIKECQDTEKSMNECLNATNLNRFSRSVPLSRSKSFPDINGGTHIEKSTVLGVSDYWTVQSATGTASRGSRKNNYYEPGRHWNDAVDLNVGNSQQVVDEERAQEVERAKQFYQNAGVVVQVPVRPPPARSLPIDLDLFSLGQVSLDTLHKPSPRRKSRLSLASYPSKYGKRRHLTFADGKREESLVSTMDAPSEIGSKTLPSSKKSVLGFSGVTQADYFTITRREFKQEEASEVDEARKKDNARAFKDFVKRIVKPKRRKSQKPGRSNGAASQDRFIRSSHRSSLRVQATFQMLTRKLSSGRSSGSNRKKTKIGSKQQPTKPRHKTGSSYITLPEVVQKTGPTQLVRAQTSQPGTNGLQVQRPTKGFAKLPTMTRNRETVRRRSLTVKSTALYGSKAKSSSHPVDRKLSQTSKQGEDGSEQGKPFFTKLDQSGEMESGNIPEGPGDQKLREGSLLRLSGGHVSISKGPIVSGPPSEIVIPDKQLHDRRASSKAFTAPEQKYTGRKQAKGAPERSSLKANQDPSSIQEPDDIKKALLDAHTGKPSAAAAYETKKDVLDQTELSGGSGAKLPQDINISVKDQIGIVKTVKRRSINKDGRRTSTKSHSMDTKLNVVKQDLKTQRHVASLRKPPGESSGFDSSGKRSVKLATAGTLVSRKPGTEAKDSNVEQPVGTKDTGPYFGIIIDNGLQQEDLQHQEVISEKAKFILEQTDVSAYRSSSRMKLAGAAEKKDADGLKFSEALQVVEDKLTPLKEKPRSLPIDMVSGAQSPPASKAKLEKGTLGTRKHRSASDIQEVSPRDNKNETTDQKGKTIHSVADLSVKEEKLMESLTQVEQQDSQTDHTSQLQRNGVPRKSQKPSVDKNQIASSLVEEPNKIVWSQSVKKTSSFGQISQPSSQRSGDIQAAPMPISTSSLPTTTSVSSAQSTETSFQDNYVCDTNYFMPPY